MVKPNIHLRKWIFKSSKLAYGFNHPWFGLGNYFMEGWLVDFFYKYHKMLKEVTVEKPWLLNSIMSHSNDSLTEFILDLSFCLLSMSTQMRAKQLSLRQHLLSVVSGTSITHPITEDVPLTIVQTQVRKMMPRFLKGVSPQILCISPPLY